MKNSLQSCLEKLDNFGLDVFDIGCQWQEKAPATLADRSDLVTGALIMVASILLLWALNELGRSYFKPPSS